VRYPDFPQLWLPLQRTLVSIVVQSWLAETPKSKNSVDTGHRIPLKGQSTSGPPREIGKRKNSVETLRGVSTKDQASLHEKEIHFAIRIL
jgi:hypothetical protein